MAYMRPRRETNVEADADFAAGRATPFDVVGDWLSSLAKDQTAHVQSLRADIPVPRRVQP
jgi:hypothetical protein